MKRATTTARDLECFKHMRSIGQFVGSLMQIQNYATVRRGPAQHLQFVSVIYPMTARLDGVTKRCNQ